MSGSGTAEDPYQVKDAFDLFDVRSNLTAHYKLMNDIDLTDWIAEESPSQGWAPIGTKTTPFTGTVDGNNKSINGLYINRPSTDYVGLFGYVEGANIHNICLVNPVINGNNYCGIFVGGTKSSVAFTIGDNVCIGGRLTGNNYVGGIVGNVYHGNNQFYVRCSTSIKGNYSSAHIIANTYCGGIVGDVQGQYWESWGNYMISNIVDNHFSGQIESNSICGGVAGQVSAYFQEPLDVTICRNLAGGTINGLSSTNGIIGARAAASTYYMTVNRYVTIKNNVCYMDEITSENTAYRIFSQAFADNFASITTKIYKAGVETSIEDNDYNGTGLGANTLKRKNTYKGMGFDFDTQWAINEGLTYPYNISQCTPPLITSCSSGEHAKVAGTATSDGKIYVFVNNTMYEGHVVDGEWEVDLGALEEGVTVYVSMDSDNQMASILVSAVTENVVTILDENSTTGPTASDGNVDIKVLRTIKANDWNTIVLPFAMTEAQVKAAFGDDVQLLEFSDYEVDDEVHVNSINVHFVDADLSEGILANYPYLIKVSHNITEFTTTSTITPDEENAIAEYAEGRGARRHVYGTFIGTYHAQTVVPDKSLFISDNKFWYSTGATKMKAYRAYFTFEDVLSSMEEASTRISFGFESDETSAIREIEGTRQSGQVYNLQGQRVEHPRQGLYIKDGKKTIVK